MQPKPEQKALSTRTTALSAEISTELTAMFMALAIPADMASEPELTKRLYADAVVGLDPDETRDVIRKFRIGELGDGQWCPKPAMIRLNVIERINRKARHAKEDRLIAETIAARHRHETPEAIEERKKVLRLMSEFQAQMPKASKPEIFGRDLTEDEAKEALKTTVERLKSPLTISDKLMRQLRGEIPIGEGRTGARPIIDEIDSFARETIR